MNKSELQDLINKGFSSYKIAEHFSCSKTNIAYWLKKFNLKTLRVALAEAGDKKCPRCREIKSLGEFYNRRGKVGGSVYCKPCSNLEKIERQRAFKTKCVDYKGGECEKCGYDACFYAFHFHHINPEYKEFEISKARSQAFTNKIKKELDKCQLLCSNCHSEIHYEQRKY